MGEELDGRVVPKPARRKRGPSGPDAKARGDEMAAMAYVAMENGDYIYGAHARRQYDEDGNEVPNTRELMRLAGYTEGSWDHFPTTLGKRKEFWQLVELYRLRRTDPMFKKEQEHLLLGKILGNLTRMFYETAEYAPHTLSVRDIISGMKTIVDLGYKVQEHDPVQASRVNKLLEGMPEAQREVAIRGLKEKAEADLKALEALEKAHKAVENG
jgi:hypothetical protein